MSPTPFSPPPPLPLLSSSKPYERTAASIPARSAASLASLAAWFRSRASLESGSSTAKRRRLPAYHPGHRSPHCTWMRVGICEGGTADDGRVYGGYTRHRNARQGDLRLTQTLSGIHPGPPPPLPRTSRLRRQQAALPSPAPGPGPPPPAPAVPLGSGARRPCPSSPGRPTWSPSDKGRGCTAVRSRAGEDL